MKFLLELGIAMLLVGCNLQQLQETERALASASVSPTATPSCADFSEYDTYSDCQTATYANCSSEWQTFSSGGAALCYYPVAGWEICSTATTDWVYTPYSATLCEDSTSPGTFWKARSVIGCSSAICACLNPQVLISTCTAGTCPTPTPDPMPACP